jgi:3-phosphoshikimate 1-carboxyvinyltransferase
MTRLVVWPAAAPLRGSVGAPSDKSIGHRALLLSALGTGTSRIARFSGGEDNVATIECLRALGVQIDVREKERELVVHGVGLHGLSPPTGELDCNNSGTTMRLLSGILAAQPFRSVLVGDRSLSNRPMGRIAIPLRARGATVEGRPHPTRPHDITAPLVIGPLPVGRRLTELSYESPVASAQVKSAILLSGLYADGPTYFKEPTLSRDHTERMLVALGVPLETSASVVRLDPSGYSGVLPPQELAVPGDLSAAAFLLLAAQMVEGSRVTVREVGVNPTRTGVLEIARDMGAGILVEPHGEWGGEPVATLHAWPEPLRACRMGGEAIARAIDEVPVLCALAARTRGVTTIGDAEELRVKESDRIASLARVLQAFGVDCEERPDGLVIRGSDALLNPAAVDSGGDHRIAMTAVVLGLTATGPSVISDVDCIRTSFPKFVATLRGLGARVDVEA